MQVYDEFDVTQATRLGAGGFGKVYKIRHKGTGKKYAAKYQKLNNQKMRHLVQEEAHFLRRLAGGSRVVEMHDYYEKDKHSLMVLELLEGGELFSVVGATHYTLTETKCARYTLDILKGINFIHGKKAIRS
jgi:serine/threonine protein kinase